jgi:(1->4)-alpha-D-glucan 1-alpha-D-glucosylmutase
MLKSMREARVHTSWAFPNAPYEEAMANLIDAGLTGSRASAFLTAFLPFARQVAATGMHNSLIQTVVKLTSPGVPDLYNGADLWDLSMVDPDNRRPVDYGLRARQLQKIDAALRADRAGSLREWLRSWPDGRIKLGVIATLLRHRADHSELYAGGDYQSLPATGPRTEEIGAYLRSHGNQRLLVAFARHTRRRELEPFDRQTWLPLPENLGSGPWLELLSGAQVPLRAGTLDPRVLFEHLPVAVLVASTA